MKWQACRRKSGDLFARSAMSSLQVDSAVVSAFVPHARLFSFHPSLVSKNSCGAHGVVGMISCGSMHGVVMHDDSFDVHVNSRGAVGHRNSCNSHAAELRGRMKAWSTSTRCKVGRPVEKELAPFQQASPKLHEDRWAGLMTN